MDTPLERKERDPDAGVNPKPTVLSSEHVGGRSAGSRRHHAAAAVIAPPVAAATVPLAPAGAPAIELDLTGPAEVVGGDVVRYVAIIKNNGTAVSTPARLEFSWDPHLSPLEASDG